MQEPGRTIEPRDRMWLCSSPGVAGLGTSKQISFSCKVTTWISQILAPILSQVQIHVALVEAPTYSTCNCTFLHDCVPASIAVQATIQLLIANFLPNTTLTRRSSSRPPPQFRTCLCLLLSRQSWDLHFVHSLTFSSKPRTWLSRLLLKPCSNHLPNLPKPIRPQVHHLGHCWLNASRSIPRAWRRN